MSHPNPYTVRDLDTLRECMRTSQRVVPHSVRSVADLAGVSHGTIGDLMTGKKDRVSVDLAHRLSAILGKSMDDLFMPTSSASADKDAMPEGKS